MKKILNFYYKLLTINILMCYYYMAHIFETKYVALIFKGD